MTTTRNHGYLIFAITALALLMASVDGTIVAVGLPNMLTSLHTNLAWLGWTLTGYQLVSTIAMPVAGKLSDEWGRKRLFLGAVVIFTASSMAAGLAPNVYWLILFRVTQAVGGGAFLPSAIGIISDTFGDRRNTAIGLFTSIFPLGGVIGPNLGGLLIDNLSWHWIFFVNVPIGLALLGLGIPFLPSDERTMTRKRIDFVGAGLFASAMFSVLYGLTFWADHPDAAGHPVIWSFLAGGIGLMTVFLVHESRTEAPMVELQLLKWRPFLASNVYNLVYGALVFGFFSFVPYYASVAYDASAGESGAILTPRSIVMALVSIVSSFFLIRLGYRIPMIAGGALVSLSLLLLSQGFHDVALVGWLVPDLVLLSGIILIAGFGIGLSGPASQNAALDLMPDKIAAVAGLRGMFRSTGGVLGTATIVLVLSRFNDKAEGMQDIFLFMGIGVLCILPLTLMIPDTARARRRAARGDVPGPDVRGVAPPKVAAERDLH